VEKNFYQIVDEAENGCAHGMECITFKCYIGLQGNILRSIQLSFSPIKKLEVIIAQYSLSKIKTGAVLDVK